jgi:hypothetical protein
MKTTRIIYIFLVIGLTNLLFSQELSGFIGIEGRYFPQTALDERQQGSGLSLAFKPELYYSWAKGNQSALFVPFLRLDQYDSRRTHFDIRELFWLYYSRAIELRIGIGQVFWGVTESQHLVDVINQTDFVEDIDGEQKLGQPMLNLAYIQDWGTLEFFILPFFRERTFPGEKGRLRFQPIIDTDNAQYESSQKQNHIDYAVRYSHTLGNFDFGVSHFVGTSRSPRFIPDFSDSTELKLIPFYDLMNQTGLDIQMTTGGWLLKFEGITRESRGERFFAFTGGYEYTFNNIKDTGIDLGVITEYLYDDREQFFFPPNPFKNHTFIGTRLAFNDVQSTDLLAGVIVNNETGSLFINVEGSRRLGQSFKLNLRIRGFSGLDESELFYGFRNDSYFQLDLEWYY